MSWLPEEYDFEEPESDVDDTPVTIKIRCGTCKKVEDYKTVAEDLAGAPAPDAEGIYRHPYGECYKCLVGENR